MLLNMANLNMPLVHLLDMQHLIQCDMTLALQSINQTQIEMAKDSFSDLILSFEWILKLKTAEDIAHRNSRLSSRKSSLSFNSLPQNACEMHALTLSFLITQSYFCMVFKLV